MNKKLWLWILMWWGACLLPILAQQKGNPPSEELPPMVNQWCEKAEKALLNRQYESAIEGFQEALQLKSSYPPALRGLAAAYELQGRYPEAAAELEKIIERHPFFSRVVYYNCAQMYYNDGQYNKALQFYLRFQSLQDQEAENFGYNGRHEQDIEKQYLNRLSANIRDCRYARDSIQYHNIQSIVNLGDSINSPADEYFPFLTNRQDILYYTRRIQADEDLYFSRAADSIWLQGQAVDSSFNTPQNEGMCTMTRDGQRMFFTACGRMEVKGTCDIQEAKAQAGQIEWTQALDGHPNTDFWESQASVSCDGSALYFASNREGGYGGTDIWVSYRQTDNSWSPAQNLGPKINTAKDEEAPFISNDSRILYFSSTGHPGLGEQDIFLSRLDEQSQWERPINLGQPVNSAYRELGFFLSADGQIGYFSSNRRGGQGGMDIYRFELSEELESHPMTLVEGFVKDSISRAPVETTLRIKNKRAVRTDANGRFFLCLPADELFRFHIFETGYSFYQNAIDIPVWDNKDFYQLEILLQPLNITVPDTPVVVGRVPDDLLRSAEVFFEFDENILQSSEQEKLDSYASNLIRHGYTKVNLVGYCDYIGSNQYNLLLSEQRANAVATYLKNKGIHIEKLTIEGKGEVNDQRPRWINRRVNIHTLIEE
ncbi:MAG: OmpA family protein [Bacteroidota bacterium]